MALDERLHSSTVEQSSAPPVAPGGAEAPVALNRKKFRDKFRRDWPLLLMTLPAAVVVLLFHYLPTIGNIIAFQDYNPWVGDNPWEAFLYSEWIGFGNFEALFTSVRVGQPLLLDDGKIELEFLDELTARHSLDHAVRVGVRSDEAPVEILERADVLVDGPLGVAELFSSLAQP